MKNLSARFSWGKQLNLTLLLVIGIFWLAATPAFAHHAFGGKLPQNLWQGFLSGLAHPVIGFDHLAFIVSIGLVAAIERQGIWLPIVFVLAAMGGTASHVAGWNLPIAELFVSISVLFFGILLAIENNLNGWIVMALAAISGLFHGYAYGEAIFGAEMTPLLSYLAGFTVVQLIISIVSFSIAKMFVLGVTEERSSILRFAGFFICGVGATFLANLIVGTIFPT